MYKVKFNIQPNILGEFFVLRNSCYNLRHKKTFFSDRANSIFNGTESIRILGPKIWELLPEDIQSAETLDSFRKKKLES